MSVPRAAGPVLEVHVLVMHFPVLGGLLSRTVGTVLVFDSRGNESLRFTEFVPPERFLPAIQRVD